jgi:hypothetical protein
LDITKTLNFCYILENFLSYPQGNFEVKTPSPPIGFPDPSIWGVPILNGMAQSHFPPEILAKSQSQLDFY